MTPTTPRKPMPATQGVPSAANPPAAGAAGAPAPKKKPIVAIIAVVALVAICVGGFFVWKMMNPGPPLPTAPTERLVTYVTSPKFLEAPVDKKLPYLGQLDQREDEVEKLFRSGKLSERQFGMAREAAWLGKNLGRMEKYFTAPPGQQRLDHIKKVVDKIDDVDEPPKTKGPPEEKLPKRDKKWGKQVIASFPADVQAQWKEFQKAIDDEQDRRKKEKKAAQKATAATRATTNPAKSGPG